LGGVWEEWGYRGCSGEEFQRGKHEPRTVVKAITYHEMRIWSEGEKLYATFVVDI
jgi:SHS2 domain-containing protein